MFENDQRVCGNRNQLLSENRTSLSCGGGAPTIQPMVTGSLARAFSAGATVFWAAIGGEARSKAATATAAGTANQRKRILLLPRRVTEQVAEFP